MHSFNAIYRTGRPLSHEWQITSTMARLYPVDRNGGENYDTRIRHKNPTTNVGRGIRSLADK